MLEWLLGRRRLSPEAKRRLLVIAARSEENLVETHVENVLEMLEVLGDEVDVDRALDLYSEMIPMDEHVSATVTNRVIARHERPQPRRGGEGERGGGGGSRDAGREKRRNPPGRGRR